MDHATAPAAEKPCELYKDHGSSTPVITQGHHLRPEYLQKRKYGSVLDHEKVWLCGTCHDGVHAWLYWLMRERREPTLPPLRARVMAKDALDWFRS